MEVKQAKLMLLLVLLNTMLQFGQRKGETWLPSEMSVCNDLKKGLHEVCRNLFKGTKRISAVKLDK